jgi:hypothetical protein
MRSAIPLTPALGGLVLFVAISASPGGLAHAQVAPGVLAPALGIGAHGGVFDPKDGDTDGFGGAHVRFRLLPFLGLEASADVREAEFGNRVKVFEVPVQFSALVYLIPSGPIQLYVGGGVGYYYHHVDPEGADSRTTHDFGYHGGGGLDFVLSPNWVLNADFRYYALEDSVEGRDLEDIDLDGWQVRGGITYYFR